MGWRKKKQPGIPWRLDRALRTLTAPTELPARSRRVSWFSKNETEKKADKVFAEIDSWQKSGARSSLLTVRPSFLLSFHFSSGLTRSYFGATGLTNTENHGGAGASSGPLDWATRDDANGEAQSRRMLLSTNVS